jgi:hypothetical protein
MTICYKILDNLPPVPQRYIDIAFDVLNDGKGDIQNYAIDRFQYQEGKPFSSRNNPRIGLEEYMSEWVSEHISQEWIHIGVAASTPNSTTGSNLDYIHGPHTDATRGYVLIYLIESSNEDQHTIFWQEQGKSLHRKRHVVPESYDNLIKINSIQIPLHTWVIFDTSILHSIENIRGSRIAFNIGFDCDTFGIFSKD